jgi:hypothetical protein
VNISFTCGSYSCWGCRDDLGVDNESLEFGVGSYRC